MMLSSSSPDQCRQDFLDLELAGDRPVDAVDEQRQSQPPEHRRPALLAGRDQRQERQERTRRGKKMDRKGPRLRPCDFLFRPRQSDRDLAGNLPGFHEPRRSSLQVKAGRPAASERRRTRPRHRTSSRLLARFCSRMAWFPDCRQRLRGAPPTRQGVFPASGDDRGRHLLLKTPSLGASRRCCGPLCCHIEEEAALPRPTFLLFQRPQPVDQSRLFDILVAGTGPSGLIAALAFARENFSVALIGPAPDHSDRRTTALMQPALEFLGSLVSVDALADVAAPLRVMRIVDATGRLDLAAARSPFGRARSARTASASTCPMRR